MSRRARRAAAVAATVTASVVGWSAVAPQAAGAGTTGGDGGFVVTVAAGGNSGAGDGGNGVTVNVGDGWSGGGGGSSFGGGGGGGTTDPCVFEPAPVQLAKALGPGGPMPGEWYITLCPDESVRLGQGTLSWVTDAPGGPAPTQTPPADVALEAAASMTLPAPLVGTDPAGSTVVNLPTWLWVDPSTWRPQSVSASAGGVTATATATPVSVTFRTGDGAVVTCDGPGTPYVPGRPADQQSTTCAHTYTTSSLGQPSPDGNPDDGVFVVSATVTWAVSWVSVGAPGGGSLPPLETSSSIELRVEQIESVGR